MEKDFLSNCVCIQPGSSKCEQDLWQSINIDTIIKPGDVVKIPLKISGIVFCVWILVDRVRNTTIGGFINCDPIPPEIKWGDPILFKRDSIMDHITPDQLLNLEKHENIGIDIPNSVDNSPWY